MAETRQPAPQQSLAAEAAAREQRLSKRYAFAGRIKFALRQLRAREPGGSGYEAEISPIFVDPDKASRTFCCATWAAVAVLYLARFI